MNTTYNQCERVLDTYSLEEILDLNDLTEADALYLLVEHGDVELPDPRPADREEA